MGRDLPTLERLRRWTNHGRRPRSRALSGWLASLAVVALGLGFASTAAAAPTCPMQSVTTAYDTPVTITLACTDPGNEPITYSVLSGPVSISDDRATFTPQPGTVGMTGFWYTATNAIVEPTHTFVSVTVLPKPGGQPGPPPPPPPPPNRAPVARCDSYRAKPGQMLSVKRQQGVLANDSDPDGDRLRAESVTNSSGPPPPYVLRNGSIRFQAPTKPRMLSYRYVATDGLREAASTLTIWVGMKSRGCRAAFDPPPVSRPRETTMLLKVSGAVRVRVRGRWRSLGAQRRLRRPLMIDAGRGTVRVRHVREDNYNRFVVSGRFGGGTFKLGRTVKYPNGERYYFYNTVALAGRLRCRGGGSGRRIDVAAGTEFLIDAVRLRAFGLYTRNRPRPARFTVADRCNKTSVVRSRRGRVRVQDHNKGVTKVLSRRQTYVARPRR